MDEVQQREYDFFMRMAGLAEHNAIELAPFQDDPGVAGKLFKQYIDDLENCRHYAWGIKEGFVFVHRAAEYTLVEAQRAALLALLEQTTDALEYIIGRENYPTGASSEMVQAARAVIAQAKGE